MDYKVGSTCPDQAWGPQAQRPALFQEVFRPGGAGLRYRVGTRLARQDWLEECTDFCSFSINKTLIPFFFFPSGPHGGLRVHHPCGPCTLPLPSCLMGRIGERPFLLRLVLVTLFWPQLIGQGDAATGSGLGFLQQPQQGLSDAQKVDHLSNAKQWGDDQRTAVGTFQEG